MENLIEKYYKQEIKKIIDKSSEILEEEQYRRVIEYLIGYLSSQLEPPVGMPSENSFGQWHFAKDELPELDKPVLCYVKVKDIDGDEYETLTFGKRFINYTQQPVFVADAGSFSKGEEIICWMYVKEIPLPKL